MNNHPYSSVPQDEKTNQTAMFLHLSQLLGHTAVPVLGWVVPILIWQLKKNELPGLDPHGKNAANWILTEFIAAMICVVLAITVIGLIVAIPLGIALYITGIIMPIIAGIKANGGEVWEYPLTIKFFK